MPSSNKFSIARRKLDGIINSICYLQGPVKTLNEYYKIIVKLLVGKVNFQGHQAQSDSSKRYCYRNWHLNVLLIVHKAFKIRLRDVSGTNLKDSFVNNERISLSRTPENFNYRSHLRFVNFDDNTLLNNIFELI